MAFTLTGTRQPREAGDIFLLPGYVKRNPPSREEGDGLTPWSHLSKVIKMRPGSFLRCFGFYPLTYHKRTNAKILQMRYQSIFGGELIANL